MRNLVPSNTLCCFPCPSRPSKPWFTIGLLRYVKHAWTLRFIDTVESFLCSKNSLNSLKIFLDSSNDSAISCNLEELKVRDQLSNYWFYFLPLHLDFQLSQADWASSARSDARTSLPMWLIKMHMKISVLDIRVHRYKRWIPLNWSFRSEWKTSFRSVGKE